MLDGVNYNMLNDKFYRAMSEHAVKESTNLTHWNFTTSESQAPGCGYGMYDIDAVFMGR